MKYHSSQTRKLFEKLNFRVKYAKLSYNDKEGYGQKGVNFSCTLGLHEMVIWRAFLPKCVALQKKNQILCGFLRKLCNRKKAPIKLLPKLCLIPPRLEILIKSSRP